MATLEANLSLEDRYAREDGQVFLTGVQSLVRIPLDHHRAERRRGIDTATFISGYPGSPLAGFDLELMRRAELLRAHQVVHRMGVNEELAATAVMGSQLTQQLPGPRHDGVVGMWYGKANGMDRALDAFRQANLCGTSPSGGVLAAVGDDLMAKSSPTPGSSEFAAAGVLMPILYPGDPQEVLELGLHGIAMSRASGLWSVLKMATTVADGSGTVTVNPELVTPVMVDAELDGARYVHTPSTHLYGQSVLALERSLVEARIEASLAYARANELNAITVSGPADRLGIVAAGKTYYEVRQALANLGLADADLSALGVRLLHLKLAYPIDQQIARRFATGLEEILVVEDKRPFIELYLKDELYGMDRPPAIVGRLDERQSRLVAVPGELDSAAIARLIAGRLRHRFGEMERLSGRLARLEGRPELGAAPMARSPYFCSGCPHSSSVAKVPEGTVVGAGTGCHVLAVFMPRSSVGEIVGLTAMGNEGAQWIGAAPFVDLEHFVQNIGDGTYAHSGTLAIRAAVAAGVNITYKLLYNDHVAMTGAQPAIGIMSVAKLAQELLAEGVARVLITTEATERYRDTSLPSGVAVWDRGRMLEAQLELARIPGVTVLIHDQECAAEKRRKRKRGLAEEPGRRVVVNERVCEGCGNCGERSNCLSVQPVETEFGTKTRIHQSSCNTDYACLEGDCPSFLTVIPGRAPDPSASTEDLPADAFDAPEPTVASEEFGLRIVGVGGTGIVTVAQTLAIAATLEGRFVRGLDQTGLSQKGGPVVSDLKLSHRGLERANRLSGADCDLYLAADLLVGAQAVNLAVADTRRTVAVIGTDRTPPGQMVVDPGLPFPDVDGLVRRITRCSREGAGARLDARLACRELFGTDQAANVLLLGVAHQLGALPLGAEAIERAIEINGAAVAMNLQAFRRGRQFVAAPEAFATARARTRAVPAPTRGGATGGPGGSALSRGERRIADTVRAAPGSELERLVRLRVRELTAYANLAYARRYADTVEAVREREAASCPGESGLAEAVAVNLHKLLAYKDEYEVARLHRDPAFRAELAARYGVDARVAVQLHPPLLRALGLKRKLALGDWFSPVLALLVAMRRLRHTRLDIFGYAEVRRVERELIPEYESLIAGLLTRLSPATHALSCEVAALPDMVRGYEEIKLANVARYRARIAELVL